MAIQIKHAFTSLKGDGTDATLVQPSSWNAAHSFTMATLQLIGRLTAGAGNAEEIPISALVANAFNSADGLAFLQALGVGGFRTGDGKITMQTAAEAGWIMLDDGTFGDATSGASSRANADTAALFTLFYNNISDANAPIFLSTGTGTTRATQGSAATAYAAHCRMSLPKQLGRALCAAGTGAGLSARALATYGGEENHILTASEVPSITSTGAGVGGTFAGTIAGSISGSAASHQHTFSGYTNWINNGGVVGGGSYQHTHSTTQVNGAGVLDNGGGTFGYGGGPSRSVALTNGFTVGTTNTDHYHYFNGTTDLSGALSVSGSCSGPCSGSITTATLSVTSSNTGGAAHNTVQPSTFWNVEIKL